MVLRLLFVVSGLVSHFAGAVPSEYSARREPGVDFKSYMGRARNFSGQVQIQDRITPMGTSQYFNQDTLEDATEWESEEVMVERFKDFRDLRFLTVPDRPHFARRSSWLYPDDGCFARAALANRNLAKNHYPVPKKIFAFGNLVVQTPNAYDGSVSWWYHVAPLVQIGGQKYVLDPALSPEAPLKLEDWLSRMSPDPAAIQIAICESGTYTPGDDCTKVSDGEEESAMQDQVYYLRAEWERLVELGRNPERELGEFPPWLKTSTVLH